MTEVWIITYDTWVDHVTQPGWANIRAGIYADGKKANERYEELVSMAAATPLYARNVRLERVDVII